jgi:hypothetical protein
MVTSAQMPALLTLPLPLFHLRMFNGYTSIAEVLVDLIIHELHV